MRLRSLRDGIIHYDVAVDHVIAVALYQARVKPEMHTCPVHHARLVWIASTIVTKVVSPIPTKSFRKWDSLTKDLDFPGPGRVSFHKAEFVYMVSHPSLVDKI